MRRFLSGRRSCFAAASSIVAGLFAASAIHAASAADVLTQHNDNARTGATLDETALNTTTVRPGGFGRLWTLYTDGQVVAQPLYVRRLAVDTSGVGGAPLVKGTFNAVVVATMHNTVYVYDADRENRGADGRTVPLWARWLGPPRPGGKDIDMWSTNDPEWGILATPVISDDRRILYVVAWHDDGPGGLAYRLHAIRLADGTDARPPVMIGVSSKDPSNPCRPQTAFNPCLQKQRSALLLSGGVVYVGFGGDGNRGALYAFDAATLAQRAVWSPTPAGVDGGIWQSGQGPAADTAGNVYLAIGNGTFSADNNGNDYGNSFVRLRLAGQTLAAQDSFTPCNQRFLNEKDLDLGSSGPVLLPVTPARIIGGGKEGVLYVLSPTALGRYAASPAAPDCKNPNAIQQVTAFGTVVHDGQTHYGNIHGSPVYWQGPDAGRIYAWGENSPLKAFRFAQGKLQDVAAPRTSAFRPPDGMPGGMLALSANGNKAGSGIVWAVVPLDGDANQQRGVKGILLALDAQDVSRTLWTSEQFAQRDRLGLFAKFVNPVVADGKVFVPTYGDNEPRRTYPNAPETHPTAFPANYYVAVYGLLPKPDPVTFVDQNSGDVTVVRASTQPLTIDPATCAAIDAASADCTAAVESSASAPAFHRIIVAAGAGTLSCTGLRVTTAGKSAGLANAAGIGFYSSTVTAGNVAAEDSGRFVAKAALKTAGTATLIGGAPATLQEFVGVTGCGGAVVPGRVFKPFMRFDVPVEGKSYRNWDPNQNYRIDGTVTQFDRSGTVLQP